MTSINVNEAKAKLSHYLDLVQNGETITICKRNIPIAEIRPLQMKRGPLGFAAGRGYVPDSFFDPLPDEELRAWLCEDPEEFERNRPEREREAAEYKRFMVEDAARTEAQNKAYEEAMRKVREYEKQSRAR